MQLRCVRHVPQRSPDAGGDGSDSRADGPRRPRPATAAGPRSSGEGITVCIHAGGGKSGQGSRALRLRGQRLLHVRRHRHLAHHLQSAAGSACRTERRGDFTAPPFSPRR